MDLSVQAAGPDSLGWPRFGTRRESCEVREKVDEIRAKVKADNDPVAERKQRKIRRDMEKSQRTFQQCAGSYLTNYEKSCAMTRHGVRCLAQQAG